MVPQRVYAKTTLAIDGYYTQTGAQPVAMNIRLWPQDPSRMYTVVVGTGTGIAFNPQQQTYVWGYPDLWMPNTSSAPPRGYFKFKYHKLKVMFELQNWTRTEAATESMPYAAVPGDLVFGLKHFANGTGGWAIPADGEWPARLDQVYKTVKQPCTIRVGSSGTSDIGPLFIPKKVLKKTYRPWQIEKTTKQAYLDDDYGYSTTLSQTAGSASTITKSHNIDCFVFNPWWYNTASQPGTFRFRIVVKQYGTYYEPVFTNM